MMALDLTPLKNAVARLDEGWLRYQQVVSDVLLRDGLMLRYKFAYNCSHKILKRYLEQTAASPEQFDQMPFADLIRTANEQGLLAGDWPVWRGYRDMRSKTSHTYDEDIALQVVAGIPAFLVEAKALLAQLTRRLSSE